MLRPSKPASAPAGCEEYRVLRCLSSQGAIVSREPPAAQDALAELGLEETQQPSAAHDALLYQASREQNHRGTLLCLRCRVSWPLEQRVRALHRQYTKNYGLELIELAAFALDDVGRPLPFDLNSAAAEARQPVPFTLEVIRSYQPQLSSLGHWARQKLDGRNDLKAYLRQQGMILIGDWALLADASHRQVREAVAHLNGALIPEVAEALHRRYVPLYRKAKLLHQQRTGRQRGWLPDEAFLQDLDPDRSAKATHQDLLDIAAAVRCLQTGRWQKAEADLWEVEASERWAAATNPEDDEEDGLRGEVAEMVERLGMAHIQTMLAQLDGELERRIWTAWARGEKQRQIAQTCSTNQSRVSRTLGEERIAGEIATRVMDQLKRSPSPDRDVFWANVFRTVHGQQQAECRLMNHLLKPEQEGGVSPMRRWVMQALEARGAGGAS